jgi:LPXTG-site transpeptidase (sortase) family protein
MKELEYTIDVVKNLKKKNIYKDVNENVIIESLKENLSSIGNEDFHFVFTEESLQNDNKLIEFKETKARKNKVKKKRKKIPGRVVAASFFLISFVFALIGFQQTIYTNSLQITAQERFQETFNNEAPIQELNERKTDINYELVSYEEPASIFPEIREIFNLRRKSTNISSQEASVFGLLEISEINLEQYVVIGTSELALQDGPGYYLGTELPGSGGNVGIAGHRTTYGAPFRDLDLVQIGDELNLTFGSNTYTYIVDEIHVVPARGGEYLLYNNGVDRLTLTTCHPRYSAKERLVVSGILKKIKTST